MPYNGEQNGKTKEQNGKIEKPSSKVDKSNDKTEKQYDKIEALNRETVYTFHVKINDLLLVQNCLILIKTVAQKLF